MGRVPLFYSAAFVLLENEKGEVLLQKRQNTGYMDGRYDVSMSGHVEDNESIYAAATRELQEEIGVEVAPEDLELIMISQMNIDRPYLNFTFACKKWKGKPTIMEPEKNSELKWCLREALPDMCTPTIALLRERGFKADTSKIEYVDGVRFKDLMEK